MIDYPYLPVGLWKTAGRALPCYACNHEIPAGAVYFAFGEDGADKSKPAGDGTPYHRDCALYTFSTGDKPPQLFSYDTTREQLAQPVGEPEFSVPGHWRTARRPWVCRHCAEMIRPGARYFEYTGESHAYESGRPYHRECAIEVWSQFDTKPQQPETRPGEKIESEDI
jgi:hypothetical protein